ncbi:MAG: FAD-dependent monooxygenase [Chloroflexota bacterium]
MKNEMPYSHAIVIGGSIAGLLAAHVLADSFEQVTIIERDIFPEGVTARRGVPQARHAHTLFIRGLNIIESYFPDITKELGQQGANMVDTAGEMAWMNRAGWVPRFTSDLRMLICSRDLLEWNIRRRVTTHPRVSILQNTHVIGLVLNSAGDAVCGVQARPSKSSDDDSTQIIPTNLVVDASGRNSRTPRWLASLGYPVPPEVTVDAKLWYASVLYEAPTTQRDWQGAFIQAKPPETARLGILFPIENNRWLVSVNGSPTDARPTDHASMLRFTKTLRSPLIHDHLQYAKPLSRVYGNGSSANRLRRYEQIRMPEQLIVLGDALCSFSPTYGQGMTVAALESQALADCIQTQHSQARHGVLRGLTSQFQQKAASLVSGPWTLATNEDYRILQATGDEPSRSVKFMHWYLNQFLAATINDEVLHAQFLRIVHMMDGPEQLFQPKTLWRMAWANLQRRDAQSILLHDPQVSANVL